MDQELVGAMVAAIRRSNRNWAEAGRSFSPQRPLPREGAAGRDSLAHPALLPTVYAPGGVLPDIGTEEEAAERRV